jgi:hypothetical protein
LNVEEAVLEEGACRWRELDGRKVAIEVHCGRRMALLEVDPDAPNKARPYTLQHWYVPAAVPGSEVEWLLGPNTSPDEMEALLVRGLEFIEAELRR